MRMPVMDGWQFAREYRQRHDDGARIICMTAAADAAMRCQEIEADGCLAKPFQLDDLLDTVASLPHSH